MYNRNPNDVARERSDAPEIREEDHERVAEAEAQMRRATDPVSGTPPPAEPTESPVGGDEDAERS